MIGVRLMQGLGLGLALGLGGMLLGMVAVVFLEATGTMRFEGFGALWGVSGGVLGAAAGLTWGLVRRPD